MQILWNPRRAGPDSARAPLWPALLILSAAATLAEYPFLLRFRPLSWADTRVEASPAGMGPLGILFFLGLSWAAPVLLPLVAFLVTQAMRFYFFFVLDAPVTTREIFRVAAYGMLPLAVERLFVGAIRWLGSLETKMFNPLASNLAFFLPAADPPIFRYEILRGLEVFVFWAIGFVTLGLPGLPGQKARAIAPAIIAVWILLVFVRATLIG